MVIVLITIALQLLNSYVINSAFSYYRNDFLNKIYYLWITPNFVHLHWKHWFLNMLSFISTLLFFHNIWSIKELIGFFLGASLFIVSSLYLFSTNVNSYVGMSGILYGLVFYGAMKSLVSHKITSTLILSFIVLKLFFNQEINHLMGVDSFLNYSVVVTDVHWYGVVFACLYLMKSLIHNTFTS